MEMITIITALGKNLGQFITKSNQIRVKICKRRQWVTRPSGTVPAKNKHNSRH